MSDRGPPFAARQQDQHGDRGGELEGRRQSAERAAQARAPGHGQQIERDQGHEQDVDQRFGN